MPIAKSKRLLIAVRSQLFVFDMDKPGHSGLRLLRSLDEGKPDNVLNDGKADARGRFWGGMSCISFRMRLELIATNLS